MTIHILISLDPESSNDNEIITDFERASTEDISEGSCYSDFNIEGLSEDDDDDDDDVSFGDGDEIKAFMSEWDLKDSFACAHSALDFDRLVPDADEEEEEYDSWDSDLEMDVQVVP
ncbi:hypothetical protein BG006_007948 [Podila minutissima]|uniref:Uncharacterized protein n=1 Tax=Podila minutissima TaxID=64525 RepID=A0A9P5SU35_9FUNG|nr:hypothetical protein BG006_007948 [Podila minutissima]